MWVQSRGLDNLLEKGMTTRSSILAWKTQWTEEFGGLQSMGPQRVGHKCKGSSHIKNERFLIKNLFLTFTSHLLGSRHSWTYK